MSKKAVLLINLGSPDSTSVSDVKNYLREFLTDERVIDSPFVRKFVLPAIILQTRPKRSAEAYATVWTEEGSPLIATSVRQQKLLADKLEDMTVYLAMRYGNPSIADVLAEMERDGVTHMFLVPLYPHYAMSSYETVVVRVMEVLRESGSLMDVDVLQPFFDHPEYIDVLAASMRPYLEQPFDQLLFSYHGIPERHLKLSDPSHAHCLCTPDCCHKANPAHATCYRHQCIVTTELVAEKLGLSRDQWFLSFQSRLGKDPWLSPYTDATLEKWGQEGRFQHIKVVCPAFVTDCLETLEEISVEGKESFIEAGGKSFEQIPCLNENPGFIDFLQRRIFEWQANVD